MRVGIAQINTVSGAFDQTVERMVAQSLRAAEQGVELLVFPLAALTGVDVVPFADRASFMHDVAEAMTALSERLACPAIVPVLMDLGDEEGYFDILFVQHDEIRPLRLASHLSAQLDHDKQGDRDVMQLEFGGVRFAIALSHADLDALDDYDYDIDATLYVSGYPFALDDSSSAMGADLDGARFVSDVQTTGSWLVGVASVGGYGDQVFSGSSMVLAPSGSLVALAPAFEEALLVADICTDGQDVQPEALLPEVYDAPFHLWQAIVLGLHDYVHKHGYTDVALCLDGTLASSVLAALASDAVGPLHVHAVVGARAGARAASCRELARRLRIEVTSATGQLPGYDVRDLDELELATLARTTGALALSSLDKTALALGTDLGALSAARLCPLGDVYRSDILDMAHVRNTISPLFRRVAPTEVDAIMVPMPDGTVRTLATEAEITQVDEVLLGYVEYERPLAELVADAAMDLDLVEAVLRAERDAEHLRRAMPPVLAMSTRTLDDARFPLGVRWHDTHTEMEPVGLDTLRVHSAPQPAETPEEPRPHQSADLDATLAMLRDLTEQGGLMPPDLAQLTEEALASGQLPGWMTPFSEN